MKNLDKEFDTIIEGWAEECEKLGDALNEIKEAIKRKKLVIDVVAIVIGSASSLLLTLNILGLISVSTQFIKVMPISCSFMILILIIANRYFRGKNNPEYIELYVDYIYHYSNKLRSVRDDKSISAEQRIAKLHVLREFADLNRKDIYTNWPDLKKFFN